MVYETSSDLRKQNAGNRQFHWLGAQPMNGLEISGPDPDVGAILYRSRRKVGEEIPRLERLTARNEWKLWIILGNLRFLTISLQPRKNIVIERYFKDFPESAESMTGEEPRRWLGALVKQP